MLQQQQLLQRDFIEKEVQEKQLQLEEKKLVNEREIKERQLLADERRIQLEREKIAAIAAEKERQLVADKDIKEKQLVADRELKEKQLQLERERMVAEAIEKERQTQLERDKLAAEVAFREKQKLIEMAERDRLKMDKRAEKEKEKIKLEYEEKLQLRAQLAEEKQRSAVLEIEMSFGRKDNKAIDGTNIEEHQSLGAQNRVPRTPTLVQGLSVDTTQMELDRRISALVETLPDLSSFTNTHATPLSTIKPLSESLTANSLIHTPTNTSETASAYHVHRPTSTTLPLVHAEKVTDKHLQQPQCRITKAEETQVSMELPLATSTMAPSPVPGHSLNTQQAGRSNWTYVHHRSTIRSRGEH